MTKRQKFNTFLTLFCLLVSFACTYSQLIREFDSSTIVVENEYKADSSAPINQYETLDTSLLRSKKLFHRVNGNLLEGTPTFSPTESFRPTVSFAPTRPRPTEAPVPTLAPVPTFRPTPSPTSRPTSFTFSGPPTGDMYVSFACVFQVLLSTTYDPNLGTSTTGLIGASIENFLGFTDASVQFVSQRIIDTSDLSNRIDLTYTVYIPLSSPQYVGYRNNPISVYESLSRNFSTYNGVKTQCCIPDTFTTFYNTLGTQLGYNSSITKFFLFQNIKFSNPVGLRIDATPQPTRAPTSSRAPSTFPTVRPTTYAPTFAAGASSGGGGSGVTGYVFIIIAIVVGGVFVAAFIYYLYATKQYCFKVLEKDEDEDEEEDEEQVATADATVVEKHEIVGTDGVVIDVNGQRPRRTSQIGKEEQKAELDEFTKNLNVVGSWFGVEPADRPVLNTVALNSSFDTWLGNPTPDDSSARRHAHGHSGHNSHHHHRRNSNTPQPGPASPPPDWSLENISSWLILPGSQPSELNQGNSPRQPHHHNVPRRPRPPGAPGGRGPGSPAGRPYGAPPGSPGGRRPDGRHRDPNQGRYRSKPPPTDTSIDWTSVGSWLTTATPVNTNL